MTGANYIAFCKILGKLSYAFDEFGAGYSGSEDAFAALYAQVAKPDTIPNNEIVVDFGVSAQSIINAIAAGGNSTPILTAAKSFLTSDLVRSYFVHETLTTNATAQQVITALIAEMTADNAYFTPLASTGMVNFLQQILPGAAIPTTGSGTQYTDAVYSVVTVL